MRVASSAWLAVVLSVMAASASAQTVVVDEEGGPLPPPPDAPEPIAWYFPHSDLTPYQIVSDDGRCLQSLFKPSHERIHEITLAACDEESSLQKFYVLDNSARASVTDFVPQTDGVPGPSTGANARIVMAGPFDERMTHDMPSWS